MPCRLGTPGATAETRVFYQAYHSIGGRRDLDNQSASSAEATAAASSPAIGASLVICCTFPPDPDPVFGTSLMRGGAGTYVATTSRFSGTMTIAEGGPDP